MIEQLGVAFVTAAVAAFALTPLVIRLAYRVKAVDQPDERKIHTRPIPRLGGVVITLAFGSVASLFLLLRHDSFTPPWGTTLQGVVLGVAAFLVLALGIWDDIHSLGAGRKFLAEVLIGTALYVVGIRITVLSQPLFGGALPIGWLSYPATILWIVGVMNAVNLIDGLDGLASGISMVAAITIAAVSFVRFDDYGTAILAVILAGSLLGFLRYNFNPAKIFLGDSGSLFLGFALAVLSMMSFTKGSAAFAVLIPALSLGLPIVDTSIAMLRRLIRPFLRENGRARWSLRQIVNMFRPDKEHIHHRLLSLGLTQKKAVILLYLISSALGCGAFGMTIVDRMGGVLILVIAGMALLVGVQRLRYREFAIFRRGVLLPLYDLPFLNKVSFQVVMDGSFAVISFITAFALVGESGNALFGNARFRLLLLMIPGLQMLALAFSGVYRGMVRHAGVEDAVRILKAISISLALGYAFHTLFNLDMAGASAKMFLLDFYFLMTLLVMSRFSFAVLNRMAHEEQEGKDPVVIYGTGERAIVAARLLLNTPNLHMRPVGFLDDDPRVEGKTIQGYPVFGGHWKIDRLLRTTRIRGILIATENLQPEVLRRLRRFASLQRLTMQIFTPSFEAFTPASFATSPAEEPAVPQAPAPEAESRTALVRDLIKRGRN
jgi:UDP-GlcNAc:undecaprenyl-phosphate GlcNAc-1-phosphate transferase